MVLKYCVFWVPNICHNDFKLKDSVKSDTITRNISDDFGDGSNHEVSIKIVLGDKDARDIVIHSNPVGCPKKQRSLSLTYVQSSQNGLIEYVYESSDNRKNNELKFIERALPKAIYHLFKDFFHDHEYHEPCSDASLKAFLSNEEVDLQSFDNPALIHYLELFQIKFTRYKRQIDQLIKEVELENEKGAGYTLKNINARYPFIEEVCNNALGESIYYNSLLNSWYNISCKLHASPQQSCADCKTCSSQNEEKCKYLHRIAVNTRNAIDCIALSHEKNRDLLRYVGTKLTFSSFVEEKKILAEQHNILQSIKDSQESNERASKRISYTGIFITIVFSCFTFIDCGGGETNTKIDSLEAKIDSLLEIYQPTTSPTLRADFKRPKETLNKDSLSFNLQDTGTIYTPKKQLK